MCSLERPGRRLGGAARWLTLEGSASIGVSTGMRKVLAALRAAVAD